ncbi:BrnA antitoxin family protein, partial [Wenzhouxiangella sp. C33]|nr:BrnA antitoxin family protein [Wenzhouxiangella limi]NDY95213.1 BrnA antitoxin family protein [Wenzhouxiangella limi]
MIGSESFPREKPAETRQGTTMRKEYDFSKGKRGPAVESPGKTRITIMLDNDIIESFRARAEARGIGYQTAINEALRAALNDENVPLTA